MKEVLNSLIRRYYHHKVAQTSASLAYYMLFSFFPFSILIGKILDLLDISSSVIVNDLSSVIPSEVLSIAQQHLNSPVAAGHNAAFVSWLALALYFFVRNINVFIYSTEQALHVSHKLGGAYRFLVALVLAFGNMIFMFLMVVLIVVNKGLLQRMSTLINISPGIMFLIHYGRFVILAGLIFVILFSLYSAAAGKFIRRKDLLPGAIAGTCAWLLISMGFSYYVSHLGRYSILYGSLGAVIVLMLWLYLSSLIIVLGAEFNGALLDLRS